MATTTAFSGFGFVPAGGADCCTCEEAPCVVTVNCSGGSTLPIYWRLDATALAGTDANVCATGDLCEKFARVYTLLHMPKVVAFWYVDQEAGLEQDWFYLSGTCAWGSVRPYRGLPTGWPPLPDGYWPIQISHDCENWGDPIDGGGGYATYPEPSPHGNPGPFGGPNFAAMVYADTETRDSPSSDIRITVEFSGQDFSFKTFATYASDWVSRPHDYTAVPMTLNLVDSSESSCTWPSTLTLEPNDSITFAEKAVGCREDCTPTFGEGDVGILRATGTLGGVSFSLCMGRSFDEQDPDAVPTWTGSTPITLSCGLRNLSLTIYCDSTEPATWKLKVRNETDATEDIFDLTLTVDGNGDIDVLVSETVTAFCSESLAFVAGINVCTLAGLPFADCCSDPDDLAALCCLADDETIPTAGEIEEFFPGSCNEGCSTTTGTMGWNYGNPANTGGNLWAQDRWYWFGDVPLVDPFFDYGKIYLSCNAGVVEVHHTDDANDDFGNSPTFTGTFCPTPNGVIDLNYPTDSCCAGGAGTYKVNVG